MKILSKIALAIALLASSALVITSCNETGKKPNNTPINKKVDDKKPEISTPDKKQDSKEPEKQDGKEPDKGDNKPKKDTEEHKKTDSEETTPKKDIQGDQPVDPKKEDQKQPTDEVKPSELKEVEVKFGMYKPNSVSFVFENLEEELKLTNDKITKKQTATLKEYYAEQLTINGESLIQQSSYIKFKDNKIIFNNILTPNYNDEVILKKGTIFKKSDKAKKNILDLGKTSKDLKLRFDGNDFVESENPLPEKSTPEPQPAPEVNKEGSQPEKDGNATLPPVDSNENANHEETTPPSKNTNENEIPTPESEKTDEVLKDKETNSKETETENKNEEAVKALLEDAKSKLNKEKQNVLVVFATNQDLKEEMPKLYYWGFEDKIEWPNRPQMQKLNNTDNFYYYLISSNKKENEDLGFIVTKDGESKFTGNVESKNSKLSEYFKEFPKGTVKTIFITSDNDKTGRQNEDLDGVQLYTEQDYKGFIEYLNQNKK